MKVKEQVVTNAIVNSVSEKRYNHNNDGSSKKDRKKSKKDNLKVNEKEVISAIDEFSKEKLTLKSGLKASLNKKGSQLNVTLKDSSGAIIRQLTGNEFLKLRKSIDKNGKIINQRV